jgi:flagellar assembly protein FliH
MPTFERGFAASRGPARGDTGTGIGSGSGAGASDPFDNFSAFEPPSPVRVRSRGDAWQRWQMVSLDPRDAL